MIRPVVYSLSAIADSIDGFCIGDGDYSIEGIATLETAGPRDLSFLANPKYKKYLSMTQAGCVLLHESETDSFAGNKIISADPYLDYARLSILFDSQYADNIKEGQSVHPSAVIAENVILPNTITVGANAVIESDCIIGEGSMVGAGAYIGQNVVLGEHCVIQANASLYANTVIGSHCIIHSNAVIGADGFGFAPSSEGWQKIYQLGRVVLGDDVEVGASTTIDRGALDDTYIGNGVKIDNQVQIAHNVCIGANTAIAASTAIAGSTTIGRRCTIAGCVGIVGHISIADDVHISGMSMVSKSIKQSGSYSSGIPMTATSLWRKNAARFNQLDQIARRLNTLEKSKAEKTKIDG